MAFPEPPQNQRPLWQYLIAPMLFLSLVLHGVILFIPTGASEDALVPPPDPEEDGIAISRIEPPRATSTGSPRSGSANSANDNGAAATARNSVQGGAGQAADRRTSSPRSPARNGAAANRNSARQTERNPASNNDDVADLGNADGPNPRADNVTPPDPRTAFLSFIDIFEGYRGILPVDRNQLQVDADSWLEGVKGDRPALAAANLTIQPLRNFEPIPYLENICLPQAPATAEILVLVEADGTVSGEAFTLKDTGYTHFDEVAASLVSNHDFPSASGPKAYRVTVAVDYDADDCQWPPPGVDVADEFLTLVHSYIGPAGTRPLEAATARQDWLNGLVSQGKLSTAMAANTSAPDFKVPYDLGICLPIAPTPVQFGVLVRGDGSPQGEPKLLRSSGYEVLDQRARAMVSQFDFALGEGDRALVLEIPVDYNPLTNKNLDPSEDRC